jgi:hypothetical protein
MTLEILIIVLQVVAIVIWKNREMIIQLWDERRTRKFLEAGYKDTIEYQRYQLARRRIETTRLLNKDNPIRRNFATQFGTQPIKQ